MQCGVNFSPLSAVGFAASVFEIQKIADWQDGIGQTAGGGKDFSIQWVGADGGEIAAEIFSGGEIFD